jgi:chromosome segregation ATPase
MPDSYTPLTALARKRDRKVRSLVRAERAVQASQLRLERTTEDVKTFRSELNRFEQKARGHGDVTRWQAAADEMLCILEEAVAADYEAGAAHAKAKAKANRLRFEVKQMHAEIMSVVMQPSV